MKKNLFNWMTILMAAIASVGFSSCGGDDDGDQSGGSNDNSIVLNLTSHKWYGSSTDYDVYSYGGATYTQTWTVYFINDHQGIMHWTAVDRDSSLGTNRDEDDIEFEYSINGNTISLFGGSNFTFVYYGNYLMEGDNIFEAKSLTSSDYSYLSNYGSVSNEGGPIDTDIYIINDNEILQSGSYIDAFDRGDAWWRYMYTLQFFFGTGADAWAKGMSEIVVTLWVDNGSVNSDKRGAIGKEVQLSLDVYNNTKADFYDWLWVYSADKNITLHYKLEYYNRFDGKYYTVIDNHIVKLYAN